MNHPAALPWLPAYADGEIGPVRRFFLRRHIARCPSCLAELEALQSMRDRAAHQPHGPSRPAGAGDADCLRLASASAAARRPADLPRLGFAGSALAGGLAGIALTLAVTRTTPSRIRSVGSRCRGEPHPLDDGRPSDRCADQRQAHGQAMAVRSTGPVTGGQGLRGGRLSAGRGTTGLCRRPPGCRDRLSPRQARHKPVRPRFRRSGGRAATSGSRDGFNIVRWRMVACRTSPCPTSRRHNC